MKKAAKKKPGGHGGPGTAATRLNRFAIVTTVTIAFGQILDPDPLVTYKGGPVVWVVDNRDDATYDVTIDFGKFTHHTSTGDVTEHPFPSKQKLTVTVGPQSKDVLPTVRTKPTPPANGPSYKYTIEIKNAHGVSSSLDPDLDVIDPNPVTPG